MINVSNEPIPEQDWEQFRKFLPSLKSFRYTENPRFVEHEKKYRICYTATVEDVNTLGRFLQGLEDSREAAEKEWYKSLAILGKIKYKVQKSKSSRQPVSSTENLWKWAKDFTY